MIKKLFREEAREQSAAVPPWHASSAAVHHQRRDPYKFKACMISADECLLVSGLVMFGPDALQQAYPARQALSSSYRSSYSVSGVCPRSCPGGPDSSHSMCSTGHCSVCSMQVEVACNHCEPRYIVYVDQQSRLVLSRQASSVWSTASTALTWRR
jgi:hypothetical protein